MYTEYFGFQEKPFSLLPDPEFLYLSEKHEKTFRLLEVAVDGDPGIAVISGEIGAGKTTLIRKLLRKLRPEVKVGLISNAQKEFEDLVHWIMMAFELEYREKPLDELTVALRAYLRDCHIRSKKLVLIIDEAQHVSNSALEKLRQLVTFPIDQIYLQIILIGQPILDEKLKSPGIAGFMKHVNIHHFLERLNVVETETYIRHRLRKAGGDPELFTQDACDAVYGSSNGTPRLINLLCDTALVFAYSEGLDLINAETVRGVIRERETGRLLPTLHKVREAISDIYPRENTTEPQPRRKRYKPADAGTEQLTTSATGDVSARLSRLEQSGIDLERLMPEKAVHLDIEHLADSYSEEERAAIEKELEEEILKLDNQIQDQLKIQSQKRMLSAQTKIETQFNLNDEVDLSASLTKAPGKTAVASSSLTREGFAKESSKVGAAIEASEQGGADGRPPFSFRLDSIIEHPTQYPEQGAIGNADALPELEPYPEPSFFEKNKVLIGIAAAGLLGLTYWFSSVFSDEKTKVKPVNHEVTPTLMEPVQVIKDKSELEKRRQEQIAKERAKDEEAKRLKQLKESMEPARAKPGLGAAGSSAVPVTKAATAADDAAIEAATEQALIAAEKAEAARQAALVTAQKMKIEAEQRAKAEADAKTKQDALYQAQLAAEQKAKLEAEWQAKVEADAKVKEEAARQAQLVAEQKAMLEAEQRAKAEAERKAGEEAERQAQIAAEQKAWFEAAQKAKADAERQATQLAAEQKAKEEAVLKAKAEADAKAKAKEEAAKKAAATTKPPSLPSTPKSDDAQFMADPCKSKSAKFMSTCVH